MIRNSKSSLGALEWVDKLLEDDPSNRKAVMEQIASKPTQHSKTPFHA
jgi:hypothetical protein